MRTTSFAVPLSCCLFIFGCHRPPASSLADAAHENADAVASGGTPSATDPELSVPRLDPKPVVWLEDWKENTATSPARKAAQELMSQADLLKSIEEYADAEECYQQAMEADPTWAYPAYQLACNYELWDQHDRAVAQFAKAIELGFDDFPTALADQELGRLRDRPDFRAALVSIRERYVASSATRVGQPVAARPQGAMPAEGWPAILLLHGYGDTNLSYLDEAQQWAELGFVAVAVPGSVPSSDGRFQWAMESTEPTHQDLQAIITSSRFDALVDRDKVFLLGFSQGALHAMLLTAENPEIYAGVVALSPGGRMAERLVTPPLNRSQRAARCMFIHGDQEPHAPYVELWANACRAARWKFGSKTHAGGHHFPGNWTELQPEIASFLTD